MNATVTRTATAVLARARRHARRRPHLFDSLRGSATVVDRDHERMAADLMVLRGRSPHN